MPRAISSRTPTQDFFQSQIQEPARPQLATLTEHNHRPNPQLADHLVRRGSDRVSGDPGFLRTAQELRTVMEGLNPPLAQRIAGPPERPRAVPSETTVDTLDPGHRRPGQESEQESQPVRPVPPPAVRQTDQLSPGHSPTPTASTARRRGRSSEQQSESEEQGR